ncbi:MAG: hypothetical protein AB1555_17235 [Nitrospirota bacterium]
MTASLKRGLGHAGLHRGRLSIVLADLMPGLRAVPRHARWKVGGITAIALLPRR